jgi:hypothetical protein
MARWRPAKNEEELQTRVARRIRRRRIPRAIWQNAVRHEYVQEALAHGQGLQFLRRTEAELCGFVAGQLERVRERVLGYRVVKPGRRFEPAYVVPGVRLPVVRRGVGGFAAAWYDDYTRARWQASGEEVPPGDIHFGTAAGRPVVVIYARPWVRPSVVARLYLAGTRNYPGDVHGPHLKSLLLYNFVTERLMTKQETWAERMAAWNAWPQRKGTTYRWVSNFHRDYSRVKHALSR